MKRFIILALLALTVLAVGLPASANAAAYPMNDSHCEDEENGYVICRDTTGVTTETLTPSGNAIYTGIVRSTATVYFRGAVITTVATTRQYQRVFRDELLQVLGEHMSTTEFIVDGKICTYTYTVHEANGQIQFENDNVVCQ